MYRSMTMCFLQCLDSENIENMGNIPVMEVCDTIVSWK